MVRNTKGGNKGKKIKRNRTSSCETKKIRFAYQEGEMYARVTQQYGHGMSEVLCDDGVRRLLIIRKKFKGRNKRDNPVNLNSILLVGKREWEVTKKKEKVDLLYVYTQNDLPQLKKKNDINKIIFGEKEKDEMDDIIEFDENMSMPDDNDLLKDMIDDI